MQQQMQIFTFFINTRQYAPHGDVSSSGLHTVLQREVAGLSIPGDCTVLPASGSQTHKEGRLQYSNDEDLCWKVPACGTGYEVTVSFSAFDTELGYDYVTVWADNGAGAYSQVSRTSGRSAPADAKNGAHAVAVQFESDRTTTRDGFTFAWSCVATGMPPPPPPTPRAVSTAVPNIFVSPTLGPPPSGGPDDSSVVLAVLPAVAGFVVTAIIIVGVWCCIRRPCQRVVIPNDPIVANEPASQRSADDVPPEVHVFCPPDSSNTKPLPNEEIPSAPPLHSDVNGGGEEGQKI